MTPAVALLSSPYVEPCEGDISRLANLDASNLDDDFVHSRTRGAQSCSSCVWLRNPASELLKGYAADISNVAVSPECYLLLVDLSISSLKPRIELESNICSTAKV